MGQVRISYKAREDIVGSVRSGKRGGGQKGKAQKRGPMEEEKA